MWQKAISILLFLILSVTAFFLYLYYNNTTLKQTIKLKSKEIDSLKFEMQVRDFELERYEIMMEIIDSTCLERINSVLADIE